MIHDMYDLIFWNLLKCTSWMLRLGDKLLYLTGYLDISWKAIVKQFLSIPLHSTAVPLSHLDLRNGGEITGRVVDVVYEVQRENKQ